MDAYPGDEVIKDLLLNKYGIEFVKPRKILKVDFHGNYIDDEVEKNFYQM